MKKLLALSIALLLTLSLFAGCAPSEDNPGGEEGGDDAEVRDTLTVALPADLVSLDPPNVGVVNTMRVVKQINECLVFIGEDGTPAPGLAESWVASDDGMSYTFTLKEGVTFHNGEPFTADDVVFSAERGMASPFVGAVWGPVAGTEAIDDLTVRIDLKYPYTPFLYAMAVPGASITNREAVEAGGEDYERNPIGTGPYQFVSWESGSKVTLKANENWHGGEVPIANLVFSVIPDASAAALSLEAGEIDAMVEIADIDLQTIEADENLSLYTVPSYRVNYVGMNNETGPFADKAVRQAVALALDKEGILIAAKEGNGTVAQNFLIDGLFGYDASVSGPARDVDAAKQLLADAGYADGFTAVLICQDGAHKKIAQVVQENLGQIGITVEIQTLEAAGFVEDGRAGNFDLIVNSWSSPVTDADYSLYFLFHSSMIGGMNYVRAGQAAIDELLEMGRSTADAATRQEYYTDLLELLIEEVPAVPIFFEQSSLACDADLTGITPNPTTEYKYVEFSWK